MNSTSSARPASLDVQLNNRLPILAAQIREDLRVVQRSAVEMAERMFEIGRALTEAKASLAHGEWELWLEQNVTLSGRSARRYMQLVKAGVKTATVAELGVRRALCGTERLDITTGTDAFVARLIQRSSSSELKTILRLFESRGGEWPVAAQVALIERRWRDACPEARVRFLDAIGHRRTTQSDGAASRLSAGLVQ